MNFFADGDTVLAFFEAEELASILCMDCYFYNGM